MLSVKLLGAAAISGAMMCGAAAEAGTPNRAQFKDLWEAAFAYWTAARACNDAEMSETAENAFHRVMNYGRLRGLLPDMASQFEQDPEYLLAEGEKQYLAQQWVVCADIPRYVDQLDAVSRSLD